jgi:hypothetical protein
MFWGGGEKLCMLWGTRGAGVEALQGLIKSVFWNPQDATRTPRAIGILMQTWRYPQVCSASIGFVDDKGPALMPLYCGNACHSMGWHSGSNQCNQGMHRDRKQAGVADRA